MRLFLKILSKLGLDRTTLIDAAALKTGFSKSLVDYHLWYYNTAVWKTTSWLGISARKSPSDMWNYQEILFALQPGLVVEFGTGAGGATLFFATVLNSLKHKAKVLSVDIDHSGLSNVVRTHPLVELVLSSSTNPAVAQRIKQLRAEFPGPAFAILDSDHSRYHVFAEMLLLRPLLKTGDYLVVEDSNMNGHPVRSGWGEGPYEAIQEYFSCYPEDYEHDRSRERKFGFTFAPEGFLIRR